MHSMLDSVNEVDRTFNVDNILDEEVKLPLVLGEDASLSSYTFQLPDFGDDFSSAGDIQKLEKSKMFHTTTHVNKTSPWHESDSGVSDAMSFTGSPLGGMTANEDLMILPDSDFLFSDIEPGDNGPLGEDFSELFENQSNGYSTRSTMIINDVVGSSDDQDSTLNELNSENQQVLPQVTNSNVKRPVRKCVSERKKIDVVSLDSSDTDEDFEIQSSSKGHKSKKKELNYFNEPRFTPRTDIKIVRVMKPVSTSSEASADDIMNALNERSKKNAIQAKINREKKKAYISGLENDLKNLQKEKEDLSAENGQMKKDMAHLEKEVEYLKSVLANASALSGLLKNLNNVKEVKLSASIVGRKRGADDDHNYNLVESRPEKRARMVRENLKKAGVCLHVSDGEACLEFCAHCASLARKTHSHSTQGAV